MEPRINHEQPGWLGAWLQDRYRQGLDVPEAECLCRRMYYRFDGIPMALRHQLSRVTLASTFAELARRGWVRTACDAACDDLLTPQYWRRLLTPHYHRRGHSMGDQTRELIHRASNGPLMSRQKRTPARVMPHTSRTRSIDLAFADPQLCSLVLFRSPKR